MPVLPKAPSFFSSRLLWAAVVLTALWSEFVLQLHMDWSYNPMYTYGWSVPLLAFYLFWLRWVSRPAPQPASSLLLPMLLLSAAALLLLPLRLLSKANPDWRLLGWTLAGTLALITFCLLFAAGGRAWVRHFAFPVLFFFVAVPWPTQFEQLIVQQLMQTVAMVDVELLNILGVRALRHGNVIELTTGLVGVEDACSGMRSLQSTLMVSIFLGELYFLRLWHRCGLVLCGMALAFLLNLGRTFLLAWVAADRGVEAIAHWHDPAGLAVLFTCMVGLWLISLWMKRKAPERPLPVTSAPAPLPASALIGLAVWLGTVEAGSEGWFRWRQPEMVSAPQWTVDWDKPGRTLEEIKIPEQAATLLQYNEGRGVGWSDGTDRRWNLFFFQWLPGQTAARFVKIHRPEICLPATGMVPKGEPKLELFRINGAELPVRAYRFDDNGVPLHIFFCYWDGTVYEDAAQMNEEDWTMRGRFARAWRGQRDRGTQTLQAAVWGYEEDTAAQEEFTRQLAAFVKGEEP